VSPRGDGQLSGPLSTDRTTSPYDLTEALGDLTTTIKGIDTGQLNDSLTTLTQLFRNTPADFRAAADGIAKFSDALGKRDTQLRRLLADANNATGVLRDRSDQIVSLVSGADALLAQLRTESSALDQVSGHISALSQQLSGLVADNKSTLRPALEKLNGVLGMLDNNKKGLQESVKLLSQYALSLGEAVASGPFFKTYQVNLIPGNLMQPFVEAAFSDLGLDPHTLLPSQLSDPQVGQPGTPPLPMPYPRTGQGGDPRLTLPDAITGKPGDPRYPYREPPPQPAPGGPPPGPPAGYDPSAPQMTSEPTSAEVTPPPTLQPPPRRTP
jgi:phospholipid/cholesterol/gamma-HCH transport system substrate-binding protein